VFLLNSRLGHFSATTLLWFPLSRSYRVNLPSSLAVIHSSTLGFSPRLPVSVYGTVNTIHNLLAFLGTLSPISIRPKPPLNELFRQFVTSSKIRPQFEYSVGSGILTWFPSASAFALSLGTDLPSVDWHSGGILSLSVWMVLTFIIATYSYICFSVRSNVPQSTPSPHTECSPTHPLLDD
jgi:hypothetical protein